MLKEIVIPDGITTISWSAFNCGGLEEITIPASVTTIERGAFSLCEYLSDVYYKGTRDQWSNIIIEEYNTDLYDATWFYQASLDELFNSALAMCDYFYPNDLLGYVHEFMCGKYYDYNLADATEDFGLQLVSAEEYEAGLTRYFALTPQQMATYRAEELWDWENERYLPRYDEATNQYHVQYMGGRGGMLAERRYMGYDQTGDGLYTAFYQHLTYEFLSEAGNKKAEQAGWPATFTYNGKVYENGPEGYYRVVSYDDYGIMYTLEYHGKQVRILSQEDYTAADLPAKFKKATIVTQPKSTQVKNGEIAKVTVEAVGPGLTYQWYVKNKGATKFVKSSVKTATYSVKMSSASRDRYLYCVIKDKYGNTVQTKNVALRMAATITKQPTTAFAKRNAAAKVTLTAAGDGLTYQWYVKNPGATEYVKSSVTKATYAAKMTAANSGRLVYCVVTDKYGHTAQTKTVVMRMQATIVTQPKSVTVKNGTTAKTTVKAVGDGLTYTWYIKNKGASKYAKSSIKTNTYSVKMSTKVNGRLVYCVVKDKYGKTVKSSTVALKKK